MEAALAKEPGDRPAAHEILNQLTAWPPAPASPPATPAILSPPTATQAPAGHAGPRRPRRPPPAMQAPPVTQAPRRPAGDRALRSLRPSCPAQRALRNAK
jgi:hypothetical protein